MTQFTKFNQSNDTHHFNNSKSSPFNNFGNQNSTEGYYIVQEPLGKRPFPAEFDLEMEYAPRAKRRFDKISAGLENFSISNESPYKMDSSSEEDDEMEDVQPTNVPEYSEETPSCSEPFICEPDDEPAIPKKIRLDESLQRYLNRAKEQPFLPRKDKLKGNEVAIWQPSLLISPKNDFNMSGRITEIDDEEEERVNEQIKSNIIQKEGMLDDDLAETSEGIVQLDDDFSSGNSDIGSSWSSPIPSPPNSQIVEIGEETHKNVLTPTSLTNGSVSDDEMMEFDD